MTNHWLLLAMAIIVLAGVYQAWAQSVTNPTPVAAVCAYSASPPTVTTGQFVYVQCDSSGSLLLH